MDLQSTKASSEGKVLVRGQVLVTKEHHLVGIKGPLHFVSGFAGKLL